MFRRARLRLVLLYVALMGATLALVATGILLLGAREARQTEDLGLKLRAENVAPLALRGGPRSRPPQFDSAPQGEERPKPQDVQGEGIIVYEIPVRNGQAEPPPAPYSSTSDFSGLPDLAAAQAALENGEGVFRTVSLEAGEVRLYSLPVMRGGEVVAVVQVARSSYFVDSTVTRLLMIVIGAGALGLVLSTGAAFWLAGRTLHPIARTLQRQRDFTADASHELRTPLALVRGNAELLQRHPDKPIGAYDDVVQDIIDESDRLSRLVSDLLTLARADSGQVQVQTETVNLSQLCRDLAAHVTPMAEQRGLALRDEIGADIGVRGDCDRLRQLALILLDNALRYTERGQVTLKLTREGHTALLTVRDTGRGIAHEHLPRLFDRFYRTDAARNVEAGGAGLGLAIAKWIAEAHEGRITVASTVDAGSAFTVHLPRAFVMPSGPEPRVDANDAAWAEPAVAAGTGEERA